MTGRDLLDDVRSSCERVSEVARHVRIDEPALARLAGDLAGVQSTATLLDPAHHFSGGERETLQFVLTLDAINFGSGWFPVLHKPDGRSGYFTISTALTRQFEESGGWTAQELTRLDAARCHEIFGQPRAGEVQELMLLFARALNDLGRFLLDHHDGRFEGPIESAAGSGAKLAGLLAEMPLYRDVARYEDFDVSFYKRAQLTVADLAAALEDRGPGRFEDLDRLTLFADNLVPHTLRCEGVLAYSDDLAARIDRGEPIDPGCPEEIEIRAVAVHAVERLVARVNAAGGNTSARDLDFRLWNRGQSPEIKARPRHRARCTFY